MIPARDVVDMSRAHKISDDARQAAAKTPPTAEQRVLLTKALIELLRSPSYPEPA